MNIWVSRKPSDRWWVHYLRVEISVCSQPPRTRLSVSVCVVSSFSVWQEESTSKGVVSDWSTSSNTASKSRLKWILSNLYVTFFILFFERTECMCELSESEFQSFFSSGINCNSINMKRYKDMRIKLAYNFFFFVTKGLYCLPNMTGTNRPFDFLYGVFVVWLRIQTLPFKHFN